MRTKTPFYELAESLENYANTFELIKKNETEWALNLFPELSQRLWYYDSTFTEARSILTMCLLFADLLWQEEMKGGGK